MDIKIATTSEDFITISWLVLDDNFSQVGEQNDPLHSDWNVNANSDVVYLSMLEMIAWSFAKKNNYSRSICVLVDKNKSKFRRNVFDWYGLAVCRSGSQGSAEKFLSSRRYLSCLKIILVCRQTSIPSRNSARHGQKVILTTHIHIRFRRSKKNKQKKFNLNSSSCECVRAVSRIWSAKRKINNLSGGGGGFLAPSGETAQTGRGQMLPNQSREGCRTRGPRERILTTALQKSSKIYNPS